MKQVLSIFFILIIYTSCTKDKATSPPCPEPPPAPQPKIQFIFVNKIGFRNDSMGNGTIDTILSGVFLDAKYYNIQTNASNLYGVCYNRNFPSYSYPLKDSIMHREYPVYVGCKYAYEIELGWKNQIFPYTTKLLRYATASWPNGETLSFAKDTIIKFVWPDDTMPGSGFHKTFQYP